MDGFDRKILDRLRETLGDETFAGLANDFVADIPRITKKIVRALETDDLQALHELGHELKGVAVLFGAVELARACTDVMDLDGKSNEQTRTVIDATLALSDSAARIVEKSVVRARS